jgi:hypothetical protein
MICTTDAWSRRCPQPGDGRTLGESVPPSKEIVMNIVFTVLVALPLGLFLPRRLLAVLVYLVADSFVFSYQTVGVLLTWLSGGTGLGGASGFGRSPAGELPTSYSSSEFTAYGIVNLVIVLAGVGLVLLGARLRARRGARSSAEVAVG